MELWEFKKIEDGVLLNLMGKLIERVYFLLVRVPKRRFFNYHSIPLC